VLLLFCVIDMASDDDFESGEPIDRAGESVLLLLQKAAHTAEQNSRQAFDAAQELSQQLRAAHDHIAQLEGEVAAYRERAERAEAWLDKIRTEIEQQFPGGGRAKLHRL
jgi:molecular chaperone GrpE (heat shock protein)